MKRILFFISVFVSVWSSVLQAEALSSPLLDDAHLFAAEESSRIVSELEILRRDHDVWMVVKTVPSLKGVPIEPFASDVFARYEIGEARKDNGLLLVIAVKERRTRLEVGRGLEGELTDLECADILDHELRPALRAGNPAQGVSAVIGRVAARFREPAVGAELPAPQPASDPEVPAWQFALVVLIFASPALAGPWVSTSKVMSEVDQYPAVCGPRTPGRIRLFCWLHRVLILGLPLGAGVFAVGLLHPLLAILLIWVLVSLMQNLFIGYLRGSSPRLATVGTGNNWENGGPYSDSGGSGGFSSGGSSGSSGGSDGGGSFSGGGGSSGGGASSDW